MIKSDVMYDVPGSEFMIPAPFTLNRMKHHWLFIKEVLKKDQSPKMKISSLLKFIGNSQMDMYLGKILPRKITYSIGCHLIKLDCYNYAEYYEWINEGYRSIEIEDGSEWVLRVNKSLDNYIHIHPARGSGHSLRVKANTLKSAIAAYVLIDEFPGAIEAVNHARTQMLGLSPLAGINDHTGTGFWLKKLYS
jgi:hypothetical protein